MQRGDVLFFKGTSPISKIICWLTKSPYSHVGLVVGDDALIEATFFVKSRVRKIKPHDYERGFKVYRLQDATPEQIEEAVGHAVGLVGAPYDYAQLIGFFIRLFFKVHRANLFNDATRYICSEIIDRAFVRAGIPRKSESSEGDVTPQELFEIYDLKAV